MEAEGARAADGVGRAAAELLSSQSERRKRARTERDRDRDRDRDRGADDGAAKRRAPAGADAPVDVAAARKAAAALVRESPTYQRLLHVEERVDLAIMRKQQDIKDALKTHAYTTTRVFRLYLCNTYRAQPRAAPPDDPAAASAAAAATAASASPTAAAPPGPASAAATPPASASAAATPPAAAASASAAPPAGGPGAAQPDALDVPSWSLRIQGHFLPVGEGGPPRPKTAQPSPATPSAPSPGVAGAAAAPGPAHSAPAPPDARAAAPGAASSADAAPRPAPALPGVAASPTGGKPPLPAHPPVATEKADVDMQPPSKEQQQQTEPPAAQTSDAAQTGVGEQPGKVPEGVAPPDTSKPAELSQAQASENTQTAPAPANEKVAPGGTPSASVGETKAVGASDLPKQPTQEAQAAPAIQPPIATRTAVAPNESPMAKDALQAEAVQQQGPQASAIAPQPVQSAQPPPPPGAGPQANMPFASAGPGMPGNLANQQAPIGTGAPNGAALDGRTAVPQTQLKCTDVFKRVVVELDCKSEKSNNLIEWNRVDSEPPADGFELSRAGSTECKALVLLYVDHKPERFKLSFVLSRLVGVRTDTRSGVFMAVWQYVKKAKLQCADDRTSVVIDDGLRTLMPAALGNERVVKLNQLFEVIKMHMGPPDPIQIEYQIKLSGNVVDNQACYDIQLEVPDDSLRESAQNAGIFGLQFPRSAEFVALNEKHLAALEQVAYHKRRRDFLESFAANPVEFINHLILSQTRDLKVISSANGRNPEEERRASFYQQQWVHEAVPRYLLRKAIADASKKTAESTPYSR